MIYFFYNNYYYNYDKNFITQLVGKYDGITLQNYVNDNLINADRMDVPGKNLLFGDGETDDLSTADLRKELFDGENVVLDKNTDHGLGEILERQKNKSENKTTENITNDNESLVSDVKKNNID